MSRNVSAGAGKNHGKSHCIQLRLPEDGTVLPEHVGGKYFVVNCILLSELGFFFNIIYLQHAPLLQ
jgi:hypothetical protein